MSHFLLPILIAIIVFAQGQTHSNISAHSGVADHHFIIKLGELPQFETIPLETERRVLNYTPHNIPYDLPLFKLPTNKTYHYEEQDAAKQIILQSPPISLSFQALDDSLTSIPPDTQGSVSPAYVMTTLNDRIRIQTKTGLTLYTNTLANFWGISGADIPFDPRILYDPYNDRWVLVTLANPSQYASKIMIAVSQSGNILDKWSISYINADPNGMVWADFPSIGFNNKWIVIQTNMFNIADGNFNRSHVYALDKANLYAGNPARYQLFNLQGLGATQAPALMYDNSTPNLYLLQNWNGNASGRGYLLLYVLAGAVGSATLSTVSFVPTTATWDSFHPVINEGFAPQAGTQLRIDTGDSRILSISYRNGSLWAAQTVFLPAGGSPVRSAIQWWQITPQGVVQQLGRIVDTAATLSSGTHYAFPSIAVNSLNQALIGYSFFNAQIYASSGFSYRSSNDAPGTMRAMTILRNGLDIYTKDYGSGEIRWGDYSNTVVDPTNNSFWTIQESADKRLSNGTTRWVTWWGNILPV